MIELRSFVEESTIAQEMLSKAVRFLTESNSAAGNGDIKEAIRLTDRYATEMVRLEHYCAEMVPLPSREIHEALNAISLGMVFR